MGKHLTNEWLGRVTAPPFPISDFGFFRDSRTMKLIIDADPIVYRCGFAAEDHSYQVIAETHRGKVVQHHFSCGDDMKTWKKEQKTAGEHGEKLLEQELMVTPEPVSHALKIAGGMIRQTIKDVAEHYNMDPNEMQLSILLSGPGNFRYDIATVKPYKGNRKDTHKPVHYQAIRNYMTDKWQAKVVAGREADDELSILAHRAIEDGQDYIVSTIDKDLDQVPGPHYDYVKKVFYDVDAEEGALLFWKQALSGDSTDNIPGATRIGDAAATKLVTQWSADGYNDHEIWAAIVRVYEDSKYSKGCLYTDIDAELVAIEQARLVFMQVYPGQLWNPPGIEDDMLEAQLDD